MISEFRLALLFLTRLPVGSPDHFAEGDLARAAPWFPMAGVVVGTAGGAVYWIALHLLPPLLAALLAVATTALITGALHEDGLADTADVLLPWL